MGPDNFAFGCAHLYVAEMRDGWESQFEWCQRDMQNAVG